MDEKQIQHDTKVFCAMLDVIKFSLVKQADGKYCLIAGQDAYPDDYVEYSSFKNGNASAIVEQLEIFLDRYYFKDLEEVTESEFGADLSPDNTPVTAEDWVEFLDKHEDFKKNYMHEYEVMKLISSPDEVDLINLDDVAQNFSLHIGIIDYDHDPQYNEEDKFINYYIAADDQTLKELTARTNLLQENELDSWQDALDSDDYISMYVNAYSDHIDVFLDYKDKEYSVFLTADEKQRLIETMKKAGMDIQEDLQVEAYRAYRDNWIEEHISNEVMKQTRAIWENDEELQEMMSFENYVEEYGFANGKKYASYKDFLDNKYQNVIKSRKEKCCEKC